MKKGKHGGKRAGAGRPAIHGPTHRTMIRLPVAIISQIKSEKKQLSATIVSLLFNAGYGDPVKNLTNLN